MGREFQPRGAPRGGSRGDMRGGGIQIYYQAVAHPEEEVEDVEAQEDLEEVQGQWLFLIDLEEYLFQKELRKL